MKRTATILALTILALSLTLGACSEPEASVIDITEDIMEDATWSGQVNVTGEINILENAVITIEPGTSVRFANGAGLEIWYGSSFSAIGTADRRISFSGANEGDQWLGIGFDDETFENEFAYCDFSDAGFGNTCAIGLDDDGTIVLSYCVFDGNTNGGVYVAEAATGTAIRYCTFGDNGDDADGPFDYWFNSDNCEIVGTTADNVFDAVFDL